MCKARLFLIAACIMYFAPAFCQTQSQDAQNCPGVEQIRPQIMSKARIKAAVMPAVKALPSDPFQREATLYLAGKMGKIDPIRAEIYRRGLAQGAKADRKVLVTSYYGTEPDGRVDCHGNACSLRTAASNKLPQYVWIWGKAFGLRQILDTGAHSNDTAAKRASASCWADIWYRLPKHSPWDGAKVMYLAVIR